MGPASRASRRPALPRARIGIVAVIALVGTIAAAVPTVAVATFTFNVSIGACSLTGTGPASSLILIEIRTSDGDLKARTLVASNGSGSWSTCLAEPEIGDRIKATSGSSRTFVVRRLTVRADRKTDVVSGRAPASSSVSLLGTHCASYSGCLFTPTHVVSTDSIGRYSLDLTPDFDFIGGDDVQLTWTSADGDTVHQTGHFQLLTVRVGDLGFEGDTFPRALAHVTLKTAAGQLRGNGAAVASAGSGFFRGELRDSVGAPVYPRAGNTIASDIATDARFTIPTVTVNANVATNVVSGKCLKSRPYVLTAQRSNGTNFTRFAGVTSAAGDYSHDFTGAIDILSGDRIELTCKRVTGDEVGRNAVVP